MKISETISTLERLRNPEPWEPKLTEKTKEALDTAIYFLRMLDLIDATRQEIERQIKGGKQ